MLFAFVSNISAQKTVNFTRVPAENKFSIIDTANVSVIPSGRFITPAGKTIRIARGAFGLAISNDENKALVLSHTGVVTVVPLNNINQATRVPSYDGKIKSLENATFLGVKFSKDNKTAFLSGGDKGNVLVFDTETFSKIGELKLDTTFNGKKHEDSFTSDLTYLPTTNELLVLDRGNNRVVRFDISTQKIIASVAVGRIPFGITLTPDNRYAFIANVGLYNYPIVPGTTPTNKDTMMLKFPAFGIPSKEAEDGITLADGRKIPGLGSALADEAMSVWILNLKTNTVIPKIKTGLQIGEKIEGVEIVGGASPNSIAVGSKFAYISNATNDLISVIDTKKFKVVGEIKLKFDKRLDNQRGLIPFGLCLSKDEKTLYAALLGFNAVAVIDIEKRKVRGLIPTGWGTTRVQLFANDTKLAILSARGYGAGPNGGKNFVKPPQGTYIGDIQLGTFQVVDVPNEIQLAKYTQQVINNTLVTESAVDTNTVCPLTTGTKRKIESPIKYIVYITKENRSFDEVLGQLSGINGDSTLARFGTNTTFIHKNDTFYHCNISPNHKKIAQRWSFTDNFYCDSDASIHGHHWMMGTIPNEYVEANSASDGNFKPFSSAPGRRFPKTTGGIDPEDYNEIGGLWENLERNKKTYFNFGESNEFANAYEEKFDTVFGSANNVVFPLPKILFDHTSRDYAGFNTNIPDQFRVIQFEREMKRQFLSGKIPFPNLIGIQLPNDHTASPRPQDGYPYSHSYVADNDLALGRMLEFLSHTPQWKNMLVIVTEDDPQGGVDHIDAHRSILMMAGPYVKRHNISHKHANFGSILRTIYHILNMTYVNQYDATASLLDDWFTPIPDYAPYNALEHDARIFQADKALKPYNLNFDWRQIKQSGKFDNETDQRAEHYRQNK